MLYSSDICFGVLIIFLLFLSFSSKHPEINKEHIRSLVVKVNRSYLEEYLNFKEKYKLYNKILGTVENVGDEASQHNLNATDYQIYNNSVLLEKCLGMVSPELRNKNVIVKKMTTLFKKFGIKPCSLPLEVDWRKAGIVTEIRNQGKCGSCYAHSVIASIESLVALQMNLSTPMAFSVQQMLDCSGEVSDGCLGGDTCELLAWLKKKRIEILPSNLYPAFSGEKGCQSQKILKSLRRRPKTVKIKEYACFNFTDNEHDLLNVIALRGPISAAVDATLWKNYLGGIIKYHCNGPPNHAVQIVGYNLAVENPYYIVRNSWGNSFGNDGYAKVAIGDNVCGIASEVALFNIAWG